jgi:putative transposase
MSEYRTSAHAVFDIKYHVVWITKYRYMILRGRVAERARDLLRQICQAREVVIIRGAVSPTISTCWCLARQQRRRPKWCNT